MAAIPAFRAEVERLQLRLEDLPGGLAVQDADAFEYGMLDNLVAAARSAGFSVHGAGFLEMTNPHGPRLMP